MDYLEFNFILTPTIPGTDLLISELSEIGFESFAETETGFKAWIPAEAYDEMLFDTVVLFKDSDYNITFTVIRIESKNWNEEWEKGFEPVISGGCRIRAPFHEQDPSFEREVIIMPRMSFGTGHHETTSLMVEKLLTTSLANKQVLDMGCGTGVLAILAAQSGAIEVWAVDNLEMACENTRENMVLNACPDIVVHKGEATLLEGKVFHVIFANINRNVLLGDMKMYAACLAPQGLLMLSGFFETDIPLLLASARENGLRETDRRIKNEWALLEFTKP
ncbi:MAG: 50S ribosomal protein L11 methyltransferase [Bacteroidia bacterium]